MPGGDNLLPLINAIKTDLDSAALAGAEQERFYISAGSRLKELKAFKPGDVPWPAYVKKHFGLSRERADELIRIADGQTTVKEVRAGKAARMAKTRQSRKPVPRGTDDPTGGEGTIEDDVNPENYRTAFLLRVDTAIRMATYSGPITNELVLAARAAAKAWNSLAQNMKEKLSNE